MDLSINELYEQYEKSIDLQTPMAAEILRHLRILYDEKNELMLNAHELKKYIEETQGKLPD